MPKSAGRLLLVVDIQNDFCHRDGALAHRGEDMDLMQKPVPVIERLIERARQHDVGVWYLAMQQTPWSGPVRRGKIALAPELCMAGTWGCELYTLAPKEDERVIPKHRYSGFVGTDLELSLRASGISELFIAGVATNVCVDSTARDAAMRDFKTTVISDACAAASSADHEQALRTLETYFCEVLPSSACLEKF